MNFKPAVLLSLSCIFTFNVCFANEVYENPYGFQKEDETAQETALVEDNTVSVTPEIINENDTYQAQKKVVRKEEQKKADDQVVAHKVQSSYSKFMSNPKVVKILNSIKYAWKKFKRWFVKLPGIRHWLASPYSMDNYKKELETTAKENKPFLTKENAGIKAIKEGSKKKSAENISKSY